MEDCTHHTTRDGRDLFIRPVEPTDKALILAGLESMSELSRYRRFLSPKPGLTSSELAYLTELDHDDHEALIAVDVVSGNAVGVARYVRLSEPDVAEAAIAVGDPWQGAGVGTALLRCLARRALANGVLRFRSTMLRENIPAFRLLDGLGLPYSLGASAAGAGLAEVDVALDALRPAAPAGSDARSAAVPSW